MVKSTIIPAQNVPKISFPKLMISENYIVLMEKLDDINKKGGGIAIASFDTLGDRFIGQYFPNWSMEYFQDYTGSVSLSNTPS